MISELLNTRQSAFVVYKDFATARYHFNEFTKNRTPTEHIIQTPNRLAILRDNPDARQTRDQTFVMFISADSDPNIARGSSAIIIFPKPLPYSHNNRPLWEQAQQAQERHHK